MVGGLALPRSQAWPRFTGDFRDRSKPGAYPRAGGRRVNAASLFAAYAALAMKLKSSFEACKP